MPGGAPRRRSRDTSAQDSSIFSSRRRGHLAVLSALILVTAFGYVLLEPRTVRVIADGRDVTVETRSSQNTVVLQGAGVGLREGDRVTSLEAPDGGDVLRVERARDVILRADGHTYRLRTHASTIEQLLGEAGLTLLPRDSVLVNGGLAPTTGPLSTTITGLAALASAETQRETEIEVRRAVSFDIAHDGRLTESTSSMPSVGQALREAGIIVGPGDRVTPGLDEPLFAGARVEVRAASAVTVALPGEHRTLYTFASTIAEALAEAGIEIPSGAFTEPPLDALITGGMTVRVVQLSAESDVEREYIESSTVYRTDPSLRAGQTRTDAGNDGVLVRRYDVSYVDGVEAGRELVEEYFEQEPRDTVVYYPPQTSGSAPSPPDGEVGRVIRVYATWYNAASAGRPATDPAYGRTATGVQVTYGVVAVDPTVIPLGTRMYIPGYGYGTAADTGGAVKGYIIDLGYPDGVQVTWQSRWMDIYVLD